ncbi:hypothetical protein C8R44DRAFT_745469 [Mycena epipterygia]|nr:hypothetical protein C8R44DRAFT_745469 [Mycena epipterygia]
MASGTNCDEAQKLKIKLLAKKKSQTNPSKPRKRAGNKAREREKPNKSQRCTWVACGQESTAENNPSVKRLGPVLLNHFKLSNRVRLRRALGLLLVLARRGCVRRQRSMVSTQPFRTAEKACGCAEKKDEGKMIYADELRIQSRAMHALDPLWLVAHRWQTVSERHEPKVKTLDLAQRADVRRAERMAGDGQMGERRAECAVHPRPHHFKELLAEREGALSDHLVDEESDRGRGGGGCQRTEEQVAGVANAEAEMRHSRRSFQQPDGFPGALRANNAPEPSAGTGGVEPVEDRLAMAGAGHNQVPQRRKAHREQELKPRRAQELELVESHPPCRDQRSWNAAPQGLGEAVEAHQLVQRDEERKLTRVAVSEDIELAQAGGVGEDACGIGVVERTLAGRDSDREIAQEGELACGDQEARGQRQGEVKRRLDPTVGGLAKLHQQDRVEGVVRVWEGAEPNTKRRRPRAFELSEQARVGPGLASAALAQTGPAVDADVRPERGRGEDDSPGTAVQLPEAPRRGRNVSARNVRDPPVAAACSTYYAGSRVLVESSALSGMSGTS